MSEDNFYKNLNNKMLVNQITKDEIKDIKFNLQQTGFDENVKMFGEDLRDKTYNDYLKRTKGLDRPLDTKNLSAAEKATVANLAKRKGKNIFNSSTLPRQKALDPNLMGLNHDSSRTWDLVNTIEKRIKKPLPKLPQKISDPDLEQGLGNLIKYVDLKRY